MPTKEEILQALEGVRDPEIHVSIVKLNMVKGIDLQDGNVRLKIALTVPGCPLVDSIKKDAVEAIMKLGGVSDVSIDFTAMSKEELNELFSKGPPSQGPTAAGGKQKLPNVGIERLNKHAKHIVAIASGKGGVGKSLLTSMMAVELARQGFKVGILDADITGPSIPKIFGLNSKARVANNGIEPVVTRTGISAMSINLVLPDEQKATVWRGPIINNIIRQLYSDVRWGDLDYLLVDLPPGTSDAPLTVFQSIPVDGILVITSPQSLVRMIVGKAIDMARLMNVQMIGLIENMSYIPCPKCNEEIHLYGESTGEQAAKEAKIPFLGRVPIDPEIARLCDEGMIEDYKNPVFEELSDQLRSAIDLRRFLVTQVVETKVASQ